MEKINEVISATSEESLQDISDQIHFREALLDYVLSIRNQSRKEADIGWLLSLVVGGAGTLMAVLQGKKARQFDDIIRKLEQDIILLKVKEKLLRSNSNLAVTVNTPSS